MSTGRNKKRKAAKKALSDAKKALTKQVREGTLPAYHLAKMPKDETKLERNEKGWLTWRQVNTVAFLTKDEK